jgi:hypothetical protein
MEAKVQSALKYRDVVVEASTYNATLRADDKRFMRDVSLAHEDGSHFFWRNAFVMTKGGWIIVFTEHFGEHVFHESEVEFSEHFPCYDEIEEL